MDFSEVLTLLFKIQKADPGMRWHFEGDVLVIRHDIWTTEGTRKMFEQAQQMFEPVD